MKKTNKTMLIFSVFSLAFALTASLALAKNDGNKGGGEKSSKTEKSKELKNYEKPSNENSNADIYKKNVEKVSEQLKNMGKDSQIKEKNEITNGDGTIEGAVEESQEIAEEAEEIASEIQASEEETAGAIEAVESQNKFKKLLIGTDYKNLGQLRSSLVQNMNQIRKLTTLAEKVQTQIQTQTQTQQQTQTQTQNKNALTGAEIQNQLTILMQERERIKSVIQTNEGGFSILGWVSKFLGGYSDEPINEEEETRIEEEVLDVLVSEDVAVGGSAETETPVE